MAGEGALRPQLERDAQRLGIAPVMHFIGWQEEADKVYAALDILVLTSLNEAVGRSLLEAQAAGVAVVASKVGGVPEIVEDGITGLLVGPGDVKGTADAVVRLLKDTLKRESLVAAARARVEASFTDRAMVHQFGDLYRKMFLESGRR